MTALYLVELLIRSEKERVGARMNCVKNLFGGQMGLAGNVSSKFSLKIFWWSVTDVYYFGARGEIWREVLLALEVKCLLPAHHHQVIVL